MSSATPPLQVRENFLNKESRPSFSDTCIWSAGKHQFKKEIGELGNPHREDWRGLCPWDVCLEQATAVEPSRQTESFPARCVCWVRWTFHKLSKSYAVFIAPVMVPNSSSPQKERPDWSSGGYWWGGARARVSQCRTQQNYHLGRAKSGSPETKRNLRVPFW